MVVVLTPKQKMVKHSDWLVNRMGDTAVKVANNKIKIRKGGEEEELVSIETKAGLLTCACSDE